MYFQVAQPIPKEDFLRLYRQVAHVTRLVFAPFGLHDQSVDILGAAYLQQLYKQSMQQLEDMVSKALFKYYGIDDDAIVASMHEFVGKAQDSNVMEEIRTSLEALNSLLFPPNVVEFDYSQQQFEQIVSCRSADAILHKVTSALEGLVTFIGPSEGEPWDQAILEKFGLKIRKRLLRSVDQLHGLGMDCHAPAQKEVMSGLLHCLDVAGGSALSYAQYTMLLGLFDKDVYLEGLRSGRQHGEASLFLHPTLAFLLQGMQLLAADEMGAQEELRESIDVVLSGLESLQQSRTKLREKQSDEDVRAAISMLNSGALDAALRPSAPVTLPAQFVCELLVERAECLLLEQQVGPALQDIQRALTFDELYAKAYSLRSSILIKVFTGAYPGVLPDVYPLDDAEQARIRECMLTLFPPESGCEIVPEDVYLHAAAEDALLGFLLGGSADLELAATAEEAAIETCRKFARQVFLYKHRGPTGTALPPGAQQEPAPWLVTTYLSAYVLPSVALDVYGAVSLDVRMQGTEAARMEDMHDIDEDSDPLRSIPPPPLHLLDTEDGQPVCKPHDKKAYALLVEIAEALELYLQHPEEPSPDEDGEDGAECDVYERVMRCVGLSSAQPSTASSLRVAVSEVDSNLHTAVGALSSQTLAAEGLLECASPSSTAPAAQSGSDTWTARLPASVPADTIGRLVALLSTHEDITGVHFDASMGQVAHISLPYSPWVPPPSAQVKDRRKRFEHVHSNDYEHMHADDFEDRGFGDFEDFVHRVFGGAEAQPSDEEDDEDVWEDIDDDEDEDGEDEREEMQDDDDEGERDEPRRGDWFSARPHSHAHSHGRQAWPPSPGSPPPSPLSAPQADETVPAPPSLPSPSPSPSPEARSPSPTPEAGGAIVEEPEEVAEERAAPSPSASAAEAMCSVEIEEGGPAASIETPRAPDDYSVCEPGPAMPAQSLAPPPASSFPSEEEKDEKKAAAGEAAVSPQVSRRLLARLLNLMASLVYLRGDILHAMDLLHASLHYDRGCVDSLLKLSALLVDMDDLDAAEALLDQAASLAAASTGGDIALPATLLHQAELEINRNNFPAAVGYLRRAQRLVSTGCSIPEPGVLSPYSILRPGSGTDVGARCVIGDTAWATAHRRKRGDCVKFLAGNVAAMLGVSMFRLNPQQPEVAMGVLEAGLRAQPMDVSLLLCTGEVHSQCGDMVKAINLYRVVARLHERNPLPYINAARTYVQLNQLQHAIAHLQHALALDPAFLMTYVDLARVYRSHGQMTDSVRINALAAQRARHVSEIRDVLSAHYLSLLQGELAKKGLYVVPDPSRSL